MLLAPLVLLALLVQCSGFVRPKGPSTPTPVVGDPAQELTGLSATLEAADGSKLVLRLGPLHADPRRQAFESQALQERLELGEGEPMRLVLAWQGAKRATATPRPAQNAGSGTRQYAEPLQDLPLAIGLSAVRVVDEQGVALVSLGGSATESAAGSAAQSRSPLEVLLSPPSGSLAQGECVEWHLWGRAPGPGARLEGLLPDPQREPEAALEFANQTGLRGQILFETSSWPASEWLRPLARVERKIPGPTASVPVAPQTPQGPIERDP